MEWDILHREYQWRATARAPGVISGPHKDPLNMREATLTFVMIISTSHRLLSQPSFPKADYQPTPSSFEETLTREISLFSRQRNSHHNHVRNIENYFLWIISYRPSLSLTTLPFSLMWRLTMANIAFCISYNNCRLRCKYPARYKSQLHHWNVKIRIYFEASLKCSNNFSFSPWKCILCSTVHISPSYRPGLQLLYSTRIQLLLNFRPTFYFPGQFWNS